MHDFLDLHARVLLGWSFWLHRWNCITVQLPSGYGLRELIRFRGGSLGLGVLRFLMLLILDMDWALPPVSSLIIRSLFHRSPF